MIENDERKKKLEKLKKKFAQKRTAWGKEGKKPEEMEDDEYNAEWEKRFGSDYNELKRLKQQEG
jgi:hypothetical protein